MHKKLIDTNIFIDRFANPDRFVDVLPRPYNLDGNTFITEPTSGKIEITGRVASLLEVGTGFHPELTGRENIFLNGAILGMGQVECWCR